ncbi:MAG: hypothetical protein ACTSXD_01005 [Candidatus Heimdallarchaeaceae archaeon]
MPYGGNLHISRPLTNISVEYKNPAYIAGQVLKDVYVKNESDEYYVYNPEFRIPETYRANKSPANMISWSVSTSTYSLEEHALADIVTDRDRRNTDKPIDVDVDTTENLTDALLRRTEKMVADLLFTTGTWSNNTTLASTTSWRYNTTTVSPILNVLSATGKILKSSGVKPNSMVIGYDVFESLKEHVSILDRIKYAERAIITKDLLSAVFDIPNIYIGEAVYDASGEGLSEDKAYIFNTDALIAYFNPNPGLKKITAAIMLRIKEGGTPIKVKKWRDEKVAGDVIEVSTMMKPKAIATACAYFIKNANV